MRPLALSLLLTFAALADTGGPQLVSSTPAQGQDGVLPNAQIKLVFSKPLDANAPNTASAFTIYDITSGFTSNYAFLTFSPDGMTVSPNFPYFTMRVGGAYRLELNAAVLKDRSGNLLVPVAPIAFNTFLHPDKSSPKLTGTVPADSETGVAINAGMYVVFDKPIANLSYDAGIGVTTASGPLKFTSSVAGDRILQIKTPLLLPPGQQVTVSVAGIVDRNGTTLPTPVVFSFQTGVLPDAQTQSLKLTPPGGTPVSLPLHLTFTKPIDPPLLAAGSVTFQSSPSDTYAATFALSGDRRSLTVNAAQLAPGDYSVSVSMPFDRTSGKLNAFFFPVTIGASADPTPAQLLAASPPDGSLDVPAAAPIRLIFSRPVDFVGAPAALSVTDNGIAIAGDLAVDFTGAVVTFKPRTPLQGSTAYTVSASGLSDFAGNAVAPYSASFTTRASGTYPDAFKVLSSDPPNGALGIDPSAPIGITLSHQVDPVSLYGSFAIAFTDSNGPVAADFSVDGAVVTFHPRYPMASGVVRVDINSVTDPGGAFAPRFSTTFLVSGGQPDTTRPVVSSVSPGDGGTVLYTAAHVEFTFSKPVNSGTLTAIISGSFNTPLNFAAYRDGVTAIPLKVIGISDSRAAIEFSAPADTTVTIFATAGIADYAGNSLVPFRTTVRTSTKPAGGATHVIKQVLSSQFGIVSGNTAITTYWSAPLDRASVEQNLLVYSTDGRVGGRFEWTGDSRAFTFLPAAPFRDGIGVYVSLTTPAHDAAGLAIDYSANFSVGYANTNSGSGGLTITGSNLPTRIPLNYVIDLQFSQDLPDSFLQTAHATFGKYQQPQVNCPFVRVRPRVLRFAPPIPLVADTPYSFNFDGGPNLKWNAGFTPYNIVPSRNPVVIAAGPVASDSAQNSAVSILFSEPASKLGMPGGVKVLANGVELPMQFTWTSEQGLSLQPVTFLQAATTYTVALIGFENLAGIPIPDRTWTFGTGSGIDAIPPSLLRIQPAGSNVSPDAVVSFTFDKPIAPDLAPVRFGLTAVAPSPSFGYTAVPAALGFSDDFKTVFLRPNPNLPAAATISASANSALDFAGNAALNNSASTFQVGFGGAGPAIVTGTSPRPDAAGVPINATIQIQSSAKLTLFSGVAATLTENGNPLDASLRVEGDGRTLTVIPARPLAAGSQIDVTVAGITGVPYHFSFSAGSDPDLVGPDSKIWPPGDQYPVPASVVVHIRFNEPLNPLSVNTNSVTLTAPNNAFIDAAVSLDDTSRVVSLTPRFPLTNGMRYTVAWSVANLAGNRANAGTAFTIGPPDDITAALLGIDPADGAGDVSFRPLIQAFFTKPVELTLGDDSFHLLLDGVPVAGSLSVTGSQWSFHPARALQFGATYRIEIRGAADAFGNAVADAGSTFTVASPGDSITQLRLLSSTPANGAVGVPADSPIRLTFNKPVTSGSALSITASVGNFGNFNPYISTRIVGNDVVIQPIVAFTGGSQVLVRGAARDTAGTIYPVALSYSISPVPDTTPPFLEYTFPAAGSTIPAFGSNLALRFSEPVIVGPNAIRLIGGPNTYQLGGYTAADGRTFISSLNLTPDSDITIAIGSDLIDLAGNPIVPISYQLHTLSADESNLPKVKTVTPPAGAFNVPVDASIRLQFTHVMDPVSMGLGLHVTADGIPLTGSSTASLDTRGLQFKPDIPFRKGALITVIVGPPAEDPTGQRLYPFDSSFTVVKDAAATEPAPIALSASATAIDVRFDAALDRYAFSPYIRTGFERVTSHWEFRGSDWLRIVPDEPLLPGRQYSLVLNAQTELPLRLAPASTGPGIESAIYDGMTVRIRFDGEINPLTVGPQTLKLTTPDGAPVLYFLELALDRRDMVLRPASLELELIVIVDGLESAGGAQVRRQQHRLAAPPP